MNSKDIYEKINRFRTTNDAMQKTTYLSMFFAYLHESAIKAGKDSLKITRGMAVSTDGMIGTIHRAGKDMFTWGTQDREKYIDRETGKEYDHNPVNDI